MITADEALKYAIDAAMKQGLSLISFDGPFTVSRETMTSWRVTFSLREMREPDFDIAIVDGETGEVNWLPVY